MKKYKIKYLENEHEKYILLKLDKIDSAKLPKNIIDIKEVAFSFDDLLKKRIKSKDINLIFYELNLMLQSNISFNDALNILIDNKKDKKTVEFLSKIKESFSSCKPIENMLEDFYVNNIVLSFLKVCQNSGNIKANIKALSSLLNENERLKKRFLKAISYPIVLIFSFIFSLISIFNFVIPNFHMLLSQFEDTLPLATKILLKMQSFFENYILIALFVFISSICLVYFYFMKNKKANFLLHKFLVKRLFLFKDIFLNMQLYKLFLTLSILLNSKYEFHNALKYCKVLLGNKFILDRITFIENQLFNGKQISLAFEESELFDDIILNLINTGEVSNSLPVIVNEIKEIYKNRFHDKIDKLISLINPIFIISMMAMILWLVLAIFMPIWDMGNLIKI